jgi:hypothetical protein
LVRSHPSFTLITGFIDKYIGDGVMAFWIPPFSAGDAHAIYACLAALAQQEAMGALRAIINRAAISAFGRNPDINGIVERPSPPHTAVIWCPLFGEGCKRTFTLE